MLMMICVLSKNLDTSGFACRFVVPNFSNRENLRFESSDNPEGSQTSADDFEPYNGFESSDNPEGSQTAR